MGLFTDYILSFAGKPYIWGGSTPIEGDGFDCSGFVQEVLAAWGVDPDGDQSADSLYRHFLEPVNRAAIGIPMVGALAFYGSKERVTHVAVCVSNQLIFEFGGGGHLTKTVQDAIRQHAYGKIRPLRRRSDLVEVITPRYPAPVID